MSKLTNLIYKTGINTFNLMPGKQVICTVIKKLRIPNDLFYIDAKFKGKFSVKLSHDKSFFLYHHGGTN